MGLILVGIGGLMLFGAAGTSDMEVTSGIIKPFTGVGLAIIGFLSLAIGAGLLGQSP